MNFSANGINKTFKTGAEAKAPYYYLTASLDLSGCAEGTYYFNLDNSFAYANDPTYHKFVSVDENVLLSEATVYSNPPLEAEDGLDVLVRIGGAANTNGAPVMVDWVAPPGTAAAVPPAYSGGPLTPEELNSGSVNYFGHEGGHFPYYTDNDNKEDLSNAYRYLALTIEDVTASQAQAGGVDSSEKSGSAVSTLKSRFACRPRGVVRRPKGFLRQFPSGAGVISKGRVTVILKVYPKDQ